MMDKYQRLKPMWCECLSWLGVSTVLPQTPKEHFLQQYMEGVFQNVGSFDMAYMAP